HGVVGRVPLELAAGHPEGAADEAGGALPGAGVGGSVGLLVHACHTAAVSSAVTTGAGRPVVAVVGATATGKSDLGVALARELGGEVVNADASQLYRGMDVGTAKLPEAQRNGIPHHQLDVLEVTEEASVAAYQASGRADLAAVRGRGAVPVVVGGSG